MIHRTASSWQRIKHKDLIQTDNKPQIDDDSWQYQLQHAITDPAELLEQLEISSDYLAAAIAASHQFPLRAPHAFISRIKKGEINDPLLQQILPIAQELKHTPGFHKDPVGEQYNQPAGLIQKYQGRVLLMVNGHCAINCRYCFRRHFPYQENRLNKNEWQQLIAQIAQDPSISEVIYSGGDPLASNDKQLRWLTERIADIRHIKRLRIHTRLPVVIPQRITAESLSWMTEHRLSTVLVLHINHANEIDQAVIDACQRMKAAGITLLNQAVLLKGINNTVSDQVQLSEALFDAGILPYYLHVLDKVDGAAHFDQPEQNAIKIYQTLLQQLPGYMIPKLVREQAGEASKTPLNLNDIE